MSKWEKALEKDDPGSPAEDPLETIARRKRRLRIAIPIALALIAVAALVTAPVLLAPEAVSRARSSRVDCANALWETGEGDPDDCLAAERWLLLPSIIPWLRDDVAQQRANIRHDVARDHLRAATTRSPDAAARKAAAEQVLETARGDVRPDDTFFNAFGILREAGAIETIVARADRVESMGERTIALDSARLLVDVDALDRLARDADVPVSEPGSYDPLLASGLLLCLVGDRAGGIERLAAADESYRTHIDASAWDEARLGILACGGTSGDVDFSPGDVLFSEEKVALLEALDSVDGGYARAYLDDDLGVADGARRLPFVAVTLARDEPDLMEALRIIDPESISRDQRASSQLRSLAGPWVMLDDAVPGISPGTYVAAARHVERLLYEIPEEPLESEPYGLLGEVPSDRAIADPETALHWAAWSLCVDAAAELARRGRRDEALKAVECAERHAPTPDDRVLTASIRLAAGDGAGCAELVEAHLAKQGDAPVDPLGNVLFGIMRVMALASDGRFDEARDASVATHDEARALVDEAGPGATTLGLLESATWLRAALALRTGNGEEELPGLPAPPRDLFQTETDSLETVAWWWNTARLPEDERRKTRWKIDELGPALYDVSPAPRMVIPAVMYVVSRSCPDDLDPEVWLDRVFSSMSAVTGTRWYLLARAETARWRDDEEAESLWSGRSERLFGLLEDDPSAFIADLAGL